MLDMEWYLLSLDSDETGGENGIAGKDGGEERSQKKTFGAVSEGQSL